MKNGFTLIELLVVVLIIGILAAIALPSYQLAVDKAHFMEIVTQVDAIIKAEEVYYASHGEYATDLNDLLVDFELPRRGSQTYWVDGKYYISLDHVNQWDDTLHQFKNERYVYARDGRSKTWYMAFLGEQISTSGNVNASGGRYCLVDPENPTPRSIRLCKALGRPITEQAGIYTNYERYYKMN